jgi:hypothetical protein
MKVWNAETHAVWLRDSWLATYGEPGTRLTDSLKALGDTFTPDQLDECFASAAPARGHSNRVHREFQCDECKGTFGQVIEVGEEPDYESKTCSLCLQCLFNALKAMEGD